ncbi:MAG: hypothetical protein LIO49_05940 [Ruminococcus sp.]|nr:hypothetical protein [Ruminococcus sp.]
MNLNDRQIEYLIKNASAKLGVSEEQLRTELKNGTFDRLLGSLPKKRGAEADNGAFEPGDGSGGAFQSTSKRAYEKALPG